MRKQAQSMPSEGWWEAERWGKKDLIAQHAKKAMSSGQSAPLPSEAVFTSPAPLWPITTVKSQTRSWEKTSGQPPSVKKKSEKMKMKFWTLPRRLKSTKTVPHPCQAEQTSSQGGNQLWAERQASLPGSLLNIRELPATPQIHTATTVASTQMPTLSHFLCSLTLEEELQDSDYSER